MSHSESTTPIRSPSPIASPGKHSKKKRKVKVTSPLTGESINISYNDLQKQGKKNSETTSSSISASLDSSHPNLCQPSQNPDALPPIEEQIIFVQEHVVIIEPVIDTDQGLTQLAKWLEQVKRTIYLHIRGFHAGICLVTICILPSADPSFPNPNPVVPALNFSTQGKPLVFNPGRAVNNVNILTSMAGLLDLYGTMNGTYFNDFYNQTQFGNLTMNRLFDASRISQVTYEQTDSFRFVGYYSSVSVNLNIIMQILGTLCVVGALEYVSPPASMFRKPNFKWLELQNLFRLIFVSCMIVCYFCSVLITPIDTGLHESILEQGGRYGMLHWQYNQTALADPILYNDLSYWRQMNWIRGVAGFLGFLMSYLISKYDYDTVEQKSIVPV